MKMQEFFKKIFEKNEAFYKSYYNDGIKNIFIKLA